MTGSLVVTESGFRVTAPHPAFRFEDWPAYRSLSGKSLKEMDVGWVDAASSRPPSLLLLELKGLGVWSSAPDNPPTPHEHLVQTCVTKATDTLLMLAAIWLSTSWGQQAKADLPSALHSHDPDRRLRFVFLVDIPKDSRELLLPVREKINQRLAGRLATFGIKSVSVVDFIGAVKLGLPVERA